MNTSSSIHLDASLTIHVQLYNVHIYYCLVSGYTGKVTTNFMKYKSINKRKYVYTYPYLVGTHVFLCKTDTFLLFYFPPTTFLPPSLFLCKSCLEFVSHISLSQQCLSLSIPLSLLLHLPVFFQSFNFSFFIFPSTLLFILERKLQTALYYTYTLYTIHRACSSMDDCMRHYTSIIS